MQSVPHASVTVDLLQLSISRWLLPAHVLHQTQFTMQLLMLLKEVHAALLTQISALKLETASATHNHLLPGIN